MIPVSSPGQPREAVQPTVKDVLMRIQPWMKAVSFAAMLLAAQTPSSGQTPPMPGAAGYGDPYSNYGQQYPNFQGFSDYEVPASPEYAPNYGDPQAYQQGPYTAGGPADPAPLYPPGTPESFQPWPQISPFYPTNVAQTQNFNRQGLWFKELLYHKRTYFANVAPMIVSYRNAGHATVGSPYVHTGYEGGRGYPNGTPAGTYAGNPPQVPPLTPDDNGFYVVSNQVYPYPLLSTTGMTAETNGQLYPIWTGSILGAPPVAAGIQGQLGFFNEDFTGVTLTGWGANQSNTDFSRGTQYINGILINQSLTDLFQGSIVTPLNGNIPLYNGEPLPGAPNFGNGSTAKYDLYYGLKFSTQAAGTNMSIYQQPVYRNNGFMIRSLVGLRYVYLNEQFGFVGVDSGFNYNQPALSSGTGSTGSSGSTGGSSGTQGETNRPATVTRVYDQYTATLNNSVQTNLAGPEAGVRFDLGNPYKGFKLWGESIFGLAVNYEQIHLQGDKIGDPLADVRFRNSILNAGVPRILDPTNQTAFNQKQNSTHVSPMYQQSIFMDFDFIEVIPVLRDVSALDHSTFRLGYTFFWVGSVARPMDSINWQGYPLYPEIQKDRQCWWSNQFTFSLNFNF